MNKNKKIEPMFKIGDEVITKYGEKGTIISICDCDECKKRGFCELEVKYQNGEVDYITNSDFVNNFSDYYQIGYEIYGNLVDLSELQQELEEHKVIIKELEQQIKTVKELQILKTSFECQFLNPDKEKEIIKMSEQLLKSKCDKNAVKIIVDDKEYLFKCKEIDTNRNYFEVARNPNKCPICDKEYTDSEFIYAIEHGTIQLKNICVDCYNKIFKGGK